MTTGYADPTGVPVGVPRPVGPTRCVELLRGITSESRDERLNWADVTIEWGMEGELVSSEAAPLAAVLAWATLLEDDTSGLVRSGFLDSLDSLAQVDLVPAVVLEQVTSNLSREELTTAEVDFYDPLVDKLREQPAPDEPAGARIAVGPARCVRLVRGVTSRSAGERVTWAGVVIEWVRAGELDTQEAAPIAAVLNWAALVETTEHFPARERLLRALTLLARADLAPSAVLEQVTAGLARQELNAGETAHYDTLVEQRDRRRGQGPPPGVARCLELLRGLTSQYRDQRWSWAAIAGQRAATGELAAPETGPIATVLSWAARLETDITGGTRARLLDSLAALARADLAPAVVLEQVTATLPRQELDPAEVGAYDALADQLRQRPAPAQPEQGRVPLGPTHCVRLVRGLVTQEPHWAGVAGRWVQAGELDTHEADTIAAVVGWAALLEPSDTFPIRQKVLHSLTLLAAQHLAPTTVLEQVTTDLPRHDLNPAETHCYDTLVDQLAGGALSPPRPPTWDSRHSEPPPLPSDPASGPDGRR